VVDCSEPPEEVGSKVLAVRDILGKGIMDGGLVVALNKVDRDPDGLGDIVSMVNLVLDPDHTIIISALTGEGVDPLLKAVDEFFRPPVVVRFTADNTDVTAVELSRLYERHYVESVEYSEVVKVIFRCTSEELEQVMDRIVSLPGVNDVSSAEDR